VLAWIREKGAEQVAMHSSRRAKRWLLGRINKARALRPTVDLGAGHRPDAAAPGREMKRRASDLPGPFVFSAPSALAAVARYQGAPAFARFAESTPRSAPAIPTASTSADPASCIPKIV
jgi:hypothetical protein